MSNFDLCMHTRLHCSYMYVFIIMHTQTHVTYIHSGCYLGIYAGLGLSQALLVLLGAFTLALAAIFASRTLHKNMLKNILRSPMSFFDTVPLGRILNRFSGDIYIIDEVIPRSIRSFIFTFFTVISTIIVILVATPIFAVVILPLGVFYVLIQVRSLSVYVYRYYL